jgi:hypothetical protein
MGYPQGLVHRRNLAAPAAMLAAVAVAACVGGRPPPRSLEVFNFGHMGADITWQVPGILGTPILGSSGEWQLVPCGAATIGFWEPERRVTITTAVDHITIDVPRSPTDHPLVYAIDAAGHIALADPSTWPANPTCRP